MRFNNPRSISMLSMLVLCVLYLYTIISHAHRVDVANQEIITNHANVISDDLWRFDKSSAEKYLKLAIEANYYKNLTISLPDGEKFLNLYTIPKKTLEKLFIQFHLIRTQKYNAEIFAEDRNIGTLSAVVYVRNIYYYFNAFLVFVTIFLLFTFITYLQFSKKVLNRTVLERTAELQAKEEDLSTTLNSIGDAVIATDAKGHIVRANPVALAMLNRTGKELLMRSISDHLTLYDYHLKTRIIFDIPGIIQNQQIDQLNTVAFLSHPDNKQIVRIAASYMHDQEKCTGLVIVMSDITETKNLEHKLIQSQRMESIGLMAGGVAHDLNNILSGIIGYPEILLEDLPQDSELRKPVEEIMNSGKRAVTVVADLLTVARGAASVREVHDLSSLVQEYLHSPECKKLQSLYPDIKYECRFHAHHHHILCSPVHVNKCLMNLVTNAAEVIADKGRIIVSTDNISIDDSTRNEHNLKKGGYVILTVQDTGPGIPDKDLEHIFEPFYTKKEMGRSGSGLGLTVVWNTMKDHDGKVFVLSSDKGTCFKLYFPVTRKKGVDQNQENTAPEKLMGDGEHILVVDDEPQLRDLAGKMLRFARAFKILCQLTES